MNFINIALNVLETESIALSKLHHFIDEDFQKACEIILNSQGKLIVTGVGKSGIIGKKIAASLSSTGTPALFLHPTEAIHGDFGMIQSQDVILALSHSGNTDELCKLIPAIQKQNIGLISITSQKNSIIAQASQATLTYGKTIEACPYGLAPTTSTILCMALGDALTIALMKARHFSEKDFAKNHPGGSLGKKFILALELAHQKNNIPLISENSSLQECLLEVSSKKLGMTCVINEKQQIVGVVTDGDIRRCLLKQVDIYQTKTYHMMNQTPKKIHEDTLALDALNIMKDFNITSLVITNHQEQVIGVIHIHDLLKAGFAN